MDDVAGAGGALPPPVMDAQVSQVTTRRQRRAVAGILIGFFVLVTVCLAAGWLAWTSNETTRGVLLTLDVRRAAFAAMERLLEAETSQRAYLLTRDPGFLPPYRDAVARFDSEIASLRRLTQADAGETILTDAFDRLAQEKLAELRTTVELEQAGRSAEALRLVQSGIGRRTMEETRGAQARLLDEISHRLGDSTPWQTLLSKVLLITIGIAALYVTLLSLLVYRDTKRNFQFLAVRERALRQLTATLEQRVAWRTRALAEVNQRFDIAVRAARMTVYTQDRDLNFTWISKAEFGLSPEELVGRANSALVAEGWQDPILRLKQRVIETGEPGHGEVRLLNDGVEKWYEMNLTPLQDEHGAVVGLIGGSVEITERKEQEARIRLLMREVTHRSKNLLSVIQAIMRQTAANSTSLADFQQRFSDRLYSLAGSHDLLVQENWHGALLEELIRSQLGHHCDLVGSQIALSGPSLQVQPDAAQHIGMALHELATNAAKYGALSVPQGHVQISWTAPDAAGRCSLTWTETCGPVVEPPVRRGFGRVVIERTVARAVGGEVTVDYPASGVVWRLDFPKLALVQG